MNPQPHIASLARVNDNNNDTDNYNKQLFELANQENSGLFKLIAYFTKSTAQITIFLATLALYAIYKRIAQIKNKVG
ncbi:hypothetical protein GCM10011282_18500 [Undibacterium macrobrachii]|uniref:Uncharacterized protein n=1 Tax=Undibacterium macrobrachii TaxID=1119058 RepID=A0ABQ2XDW0_9BURK|nr:hypothetical protein GCM10011282_18500 [Undibacterium macrobrachii]